ncbi:MAG: prolyl oligopeptidase family serine peptidase, partial [Nitrososphaera sp.]|nr:prolyl oligopeptidase family serine peptidase [Nitrososphaera sp.]
YDFADDGRKIVAAFTQNGMWKLGVIDLVQTYGDAMEILDLPYTEISDVQVHGKDVYFLAGSPSGPESLVQMNLDTKEMKVIKRSSSVEIDPGYISFPEPIVFPTTDGAEAYGLYYPPTNKDFTAPDGESPLLLIMAHGGPTSAAKTSMALAMVQYWTSRGFGIVDVNYRGSTGYGREYRNLLHDSWGVVDIDDCVNAARYLAEKGLVDRDRLCIRGWSAGGYTTLAALAFRPGIFAAGASHFGVSDAELLTKLTHKFEARYLDRLIGRYPEQAELYRERSPIHSIGNIRSPTILFQGLEDKIVLPEQAKDMFNALVQRGVPTSLVLFEGEGHGFRGEEAIKQTLRDELSFYSQVFGFELADPVPPVKIENL